MLARLQWAGELTAVYVLDARDEAVGDLIRVREDEVIVARKAKKRLNAFLLRKRVYLCRQVRSMLLLTGFTVLPCPVRPSKGNCRNISIRWMKTPKRVTRLTDQIRQHLIPTWGLAPMVPALQAARGVSLIVAATVLAELGDLSCFDNTSQLMTNLGLLPSSTPVARASKKAVSPKLAMAMSAKRWLKPPEHTGCKRGSVAHYSNASRGCLTGSAKSPGKLNCVYGHALES